MCIRDRALTACGAGGNKSAKDDKTLTVGVMTLDDTTEPLWDKVKELAKDCLLYTSIICC